MSAPVKAGYEYLTWSGIWSGKVERIECENYEIVGVNQHGVVVSFLENGHLVRMVSHIQQMWPLMLAPDPDA